MIDWIKIEQELARESVIYRKHPGQSAVIQLRKHYKVIEVNKKKIKITYKQCK